MTEFVSSTCSKKPLEPTSFQSQHLGDIVQKFECEIWTEDIPLFGHVPYFSATIGLVCAARLQLKSRK